MRLNECLLKRNKRLLLQVFIQFIFNIFFDRILITFVFIKILNMYLFISGAEIFVILVIAVMLFGADKLPEIARGLGKGMRQIKDATNDIKHEIQKGAEKNDIDLNVASKVRDEISKVKDNVEEYTRPVAKIKNKIIDDITGPIKRNL